MNMQITSPDRITYPIVETFHSIQGEGYWTGVNAFFIRLGGCDVHCPWCFVSGTSILMGDLTEKPIETIQIGDRVMSFDRGKLVKTKVTHVHRPRIAETIALEFESGLVTSCTPDHQYKLIGTNTLRQAEYIQEAYSIDKSNLDFTEADIDDRAEYLVGAVARKVRQIESEEKKQWLKPDKVVTRFFAGAREVYNFATESGYYFADRHLVKNCDTKQSWNASLHPQRAIEDLIKEATTANPAIVVITGGEPLMHDLNPLTEQLHSHHLRVHLETSGAHPFSGEFDWVTFSPKRFKPPHNSIYDRADELKVVVANAEDLQWAEEQAAKIPDGALKYLQPEWNTPDSQELICQYILQHREWRLGLQIHKFLGVR